MDIGLAVSSSEIFSVQSNYVCNLSERMEDFFNDKKYGNDLKALYIGVTLFDEKAAAFFKRKKAKYVGAKIQYTEKGLTFEIEKTLEYEIWLQRDKIKSTDGETDFLLYLSSELISSLSVFDSLKKIKDFDRKRFTSDLIKFLAHG